MERFICKRKTTLTPVVPVRSSEGHAGTTPRQMEGLRLRAPVQLVVELGLKARLSDGRPFLTPTPVSKFKALLEGVRPPPEPSFCLAQYLMPT